MANTQDKKVVVKGTTPAGIAIFPKLFEADYKWKPEGTYSIKLRLKEDEAQPLVEKIEKIIADRFAEAEAECKNVRDRNKLKEADRSYYEEVDEDNNKTGYVIFNFKHDASGVSKKTGKKWTWQPAVFDGKGKPIIKPDYQVWGGSVVRVAYELSPYSQNIGVGCSLRLMACQILELATGQSRDASAFGFGEEDDGFDSGMGGGYGESVRDTDPEVDGNGGAGDDDGDF